MVDPDFGRSAKGSSIKDVSPKGEGGGYKKCPKRRRSLVDLGRQGEGGYPKNLKFGETSSMDGPLRHGYNRNYHFNQFRKIKKLSDWAKIM